MTAPSMPTCPHCLGNGGGPAFVSGTDGCNFKKHVVCRTCDGRGTVTEARLALIAQGKALRDARVAQQESLREASKRLCISPAELSDIELGRKIAPVWLRRHWGQE